MRYVTLLLPILATTASAAPFTEVLGARLTAFAFENHVIATFDQLARVVTELESPEAIARLRDAAARRANGDEVLGLVYDYLPDAAAEDALRTRSGLRHPVLGSEVGSSRPGPRVIALTTRLLGRGLPVRDAWTVIAFKKVF